MPILKLIFLAIRLKQKTKNLVPYISMIAGKRYFRFNYKCHISSCVIVMKTNGNILFEALHTHYVCVKHVFLTGKDHNIQSLVL